MYLSFKQSLSAISLVFLMAFSVSAAPNNTEIPALLEKANDLYYFKSKVDNSYSYYQQALDMGSVLAKAQLAKMMYLGAGMPENKTKAQTWFTQVLPGLEDQARQHNAFAQYLYGYYWDSGFTQSQSNSNAFHWYQLAAEQGYAPAQNNLASLYDGGEDIPKDHYQAVAWLSKAAEQGHCMAQNNLADKYYSGKGVAQDYTLAMNWYKKAAEQGHAKSQYDVGYQYEKGLGVDQNYRKAAHWFKKSAIQGHSNAQYHLGKLYYYGHGGSEDNTLAFYWLSKSSDQNNGHAQAILGEMYAEGYGVAVDYAMAEKLYNKAILNGSKSARKKLAGLEEKKIEDLEELEDLEAAKTAQRKFRNFEFPDTDCNEPSVPSFSEATTSGVNRFNNRLSKWNSCLNRAARKDLRALNAFIVEMDGDVDESSDGYFNWSIPGYYQCGDELDNIIVELESRESDRDDERDSMRRSIDHMESRINKHNFWQGLNNSLGIN